MHWILAIAGASLTGWQAFELWRGSLVRRWPVARGRIVRAGVRTRGAHRTRYIAEVEYHYRVGEATLTGTRLRFGAKALHTSAQGAAAELAGAEPGVEVDVRYNPRRPSESVLRAGVSAVDVWFLAVGLAIFAAGLWA